MLLYHYYNNYYYYYFSTVLLTYYVLYQPISSSELFMFSVVLPSIYRITLFLRVHNGKKVNTVFLSYPCHRTLCMAKFFTTVFNFNEFIVAN